MTKTSETLTENIFRAVYGPTTFLEKSAIPDNMGFESKSKKKLTDLSISNAKGYPDFFLDSFEDFALVVEAKATNQKEAIQDVKHYMQHNNINKDLIGIALSGQNKTSLKVSYFLKQKGGQIVNISKNVEDRLLPLPEVETLY